LRELGANPGAREDGTSLQPGFTRDESGPYERRVGEVRQRALRAIERNREALSAEAGDRLDDLVRRQDPSGVDSRYLAAVAEPAYRTAFGKMVMHGPMATLRWTQLEQQAVQEVNAAEEARTLQVGVTTSGGFAVPFTLDPT